MKTIFQKDLRENFKIALIGLGIFSLLLIQAYQSCQNMLASVFRNSGSVMVSSLQPLLSENLLVEAMFFCAIFGAGLGWLQTRNEAHRDLWAFLIHRPLSRTDIFRGKFAAGLCLYGFGAGLPLLILIIVVRIPGHVAAPFEWPMVLPLLAIFLSGVVHYFAGLLTGLRQARWYGSKCFGIGLGILASAAALNAEYFWQTLGATLLATAILALAAWGAYQNGGYYRGQPKAGKAALAIAMATGCAVVLFAAVALMMALVVQPFIHRVLVYSYYQMTRDGKIYKETLQDNELKSIEDLDGHPLIDPNTGQPMERREFDQRRGYGMTAFANEADSENHFGYRQSARFFGAWDVVDKKLWYLDVQGKLVGYDGLTRRFLGTIKPPGFNGTSTGERFLTSSIRQSYYYNGYSGEPSARSLPTARTVYLVDLKARELKPIYTITNNDEITGSAESRMILYDAGTNLTQNILVTTRKSVFLMVTDGRLIFETPYVSNSVEYPRVSLTYLISNFGGGATNRFALWFFPDFLLNQQSGWKMATHVEWIAANDSVTQRADLPTLQIAADLESWPERAASVLAPPALLVPAQKHFVQFEPLMSCALDLLCVLACGWLARRYHFAFGATVGWIIFVLVFGVVGILTLLCVQEWPAREVCQNCRKLRVVDRGQCDYCAAEFPAPEKNGTEIFAPLEKA